MKPFNNVQVNKILSSLQHTLTKLFCILNDIPDVNEHALPAFLLPTLFFVTVLFVTVLFVTVLLHEDTEPILSANQLTALANDI